MRKATETDVFKLYCYNAFIAGYPSARGSDIIPDASLPEHHVRHILLHWDVTQVVRSGIQSILHKLLDHTGFHHCHSTCLQSPSHCSASAHSHGLLWFVAFWMGLTQTKTQGPFVQGKKFRPQWPEVAWYENRICDNMTQQYYHYCCITVVGLPLHSDCSKISTY